MLSWLLICAIANAQPYNIWYQQTAYIVYSSFRDSYLTFSFGNISNYHDIRFEYDITSFIQVCSFCRSITIKYSIDGATWSTMETYRPQSTGNHAYINQTIYFPSSVDYQQSLSIIIELDDSSQWPVNSDHYIVIFKNLYIFGMTDTESETTIHPTIIPSLQPTFNPTMDPTNEPTKDPTPQNLDVPPSYPTKFPSIAPTGITTLHAIMVCYWFIVYPDL